MGELNLHFIANMKDIAVNTIDTISLNNFCSTLTSRIYALKFETIRSQVTTNGGFNMLYLSTPDENMSILGSKLITYWNLCVNHDILWDISKHTLGFSVIL